jgi:hypothetical protein
MQTPACRPLPGPGLAAFGHIGSHEAESLSQAVKERVARRLLPGEDHGAGIDSAAARWRFFTKGM